nr:hypothetical protein [uncultured Mediterranean phage uvMED]BAR31669.1 hypothetical protein [uncultured Mediterranean phage uvMED]
MAYTTIDKPTDYFRVKTYSGNSSTQSITWDESDNMKADWLWLKGRGYADGHALVDVIRGSTKNISSDSTTAEFTQTNGVTSLDTNGWSMGNWSAINRSSSGTAVGWGWLAGGTASSNSDGSITSSVSANTTAGFSIVSWTADGGNTSTIGHGLSATPQIIFYKRRDASSSWYVWVNGLIDGSQDYLFLESTAAKGDLSGYGTPSSTTITNLGWGSGNSLIAYCFAEKKGFSRFGSYVGNGSSDGSYIHLGFKPAFFLLKSSSSGSSSFDWVLLDNKRPGYNVVNKLLYPNGNFAEGTSDIGDFTSNGFKIRSSNQTFNKSGDTFIYMAFAESPFVTSTGIPTTAR